MKFTNGRLDRFISQHSEFSLADTRLLIAQKRIIVDGQAAHSIQQKVSQFTHIVVDGRCLQNNQALYIMLNKPQGVVSASKDLQHRTVIDLLEHPQKNQLHIVGRLDLNTTGLVLLSNDGAWSRQVSLPETRLAKTYVVTLSKPLTPEYVAVFREGIYFAYENITTQPADLEILSAYHAKLTLTEGKYHQVKRMMHYCENEVTYLKRIKIGALKLDDTLNLGEYRNLTSEEINLFM